MARLINWTHDLAAQFNFCVCADRKTINVGRRIELNKKRLRHKRKKGIS